MTEEKKTADRAPDSAPVPPLANAPPLTETETPEVAVVTAGEPAISEALREAVARVAAMTAELEALKARDRAVREEYAQAVLALLEMHRAANPDIPAELITGSTLSEVVDSVRRARDLVNRVRELAEAGAGRNTVPAGAPGRQLPATEGLSPREKIALGIKKKGA